MLTKPILVYFLLIYLYIIQTADIISDIILYYIILFIYPYIIFCEGNV